MAKKTAQLNIRIEADDLKILNAIEENHYINPSLLTRGLIKAAINFYRENGWFSFPASVTCAVPENVLKVGGRVVPESVKSAQASKFVKK